MLIVTRKQNESVKIDLHEDTDPATTVGELFAEGPIEVAVKNIQRNQVKLGIQASSRFLILREELYAARPAKR